jgi:hypothetical protein
MKRSVTKIESHVRSSKGCAFFQLERGDPWSNANDKISYQHRYTRAPTMKSQRVFSRASLDCNIHAFRDHDAFDWLTLLKRVKEKLL